MNSDGIAKIDQLGRNKFADQIVKSLISSFDAINESIVIGICGEWGSGKSTLLSFIEDHLNTAYSNDHDKYEIISFNSWANTGTNELQRSLLESIIHSLDTIKWKESIEDANNSFKKYLKYLNYLKFIKHVHPIAENIVDAIDDYTNKVSINTIDEIKEQADKLIKQKGIKLYILIDDLDRLTPEEITSLFKVLKLNINFINTFFIIAYDKEIVINALESAYGKNGEKYLEKIIQADFLIPQLLEEQIEEIFFKNMKDIFLHLNIKYDERKVFSVWKYHGLREYFNNLRDIKRFFNTLFFSLPNIAEEINVYDFISLEAIKVFDHGSYEKIYADTRIIRRRAIWESISYNEETIALYTNTTTQSILRYLFIVKTNYAFYKDSLNAKRLKDSEFFERYFSLYISSKDVTEEKLKLFLTKDSNKKEILKEILENGKIKNFLRRLSDNDLGKYYQLDDEKIFFEFLGFWDNYPDEITPELDEYIWNSYFNIAHAFTDKFKGAKLAIKELFLNWGNPMPMRFVFNYFINLFEVEGRTDKQFHSQVREQVDLMSEELQTSFKEYLLKLASNYLYSFSRDNPNWITILFINAYALNCKSEYIIEAERYFKNANFLVNLIKFNFLMIESESNKPIDIRLDKKDIFFPNNLYHVFMDSLKTIKKGALNETDQEYVDFFLKHIIINGNNKI